MKVNKLCLLSLMLCTSFLLASCNENGNSQSGSSEVIENEAENPVYKKFFGELEQNVTIKVLENDTAIKMGYFDELLSAFNEKYKEYGITAVDANQGEFSDLANSGPYGYGPDVIYQANDIIMKYVDQKHVTPLPKSKIEAYSMIPEEAWKAYQANVSGNEYTFGIPLNIQSGLLYYRKDLLPDDWKTNWDKDNNNVPDMTENLVDLYNFSKQRHASNSEQYGFEYSINDFYFSSGFLFSYGGYVFGNNNTNDEDIGLGKGNAKLGGQLIRQLASIMSVSCQDDSAKLSISGNMASGKYFASITTPDVRSVIVDAVAKEYQKSEKLSSEEAMKKAEDNIVGVTFPKIPANGDLENPSDEMIDCVQMGGINGYAISSYTKVPVASLAFINFATSYEMVKLRQSILGIAPCRSDVSDESDTLSQQLFEKVVNGKISLMPSISSVSSIWTPTGSFLEDLAADPRRDKPKFDTLDKIQAGLDQTSQAIYDAIHKIGN